MTRTYRSFAKINLHLQVDSRRPDGYHQLRTVFQTVSLHDLVSIGESSGAGIELEVPAGGAPPDESNLAYRAARAFLDRWAPGRGVRIELTKRIPAGGGLGGGSSNAALVLETLPAILGVEAPPDELRSIACDLGADVPYFLVGGTALGLGRGDEIVALPELPEERLTLVDPGVEVSTAEIFAALRRPTPRPMPPGLLDFLASGRVAGIAALEGFNDLEETVLKSVAAVRSVYNALGRAGASCVRLSGSGGTVFACFAEWERRREVEPGLRGDARMFEVRTMSRRKVAEARLVAHEEGDGQ